MCSKSLVYETLSVKGFVVWWDVFRVGFAFLEYRKVEKDTATSALSCLFCCGSQGYKPPLQGVYACSFYWTLCIICVYIKINTLRFLGQYKVQMFGDSVNPAWGVVWVDSVFVFEVAILGLKTFLGSFNETIFLRRCFRSTVYLNLSACSILYFGSLVRWPDLPSQSLVLN